MTSRAGCRLTLIALGLIAALTGAADAGKPKGSIKLERLPSWVREAAERKSTPGGNEDLVWIYDETIVEPLEAGGIRTIRRVAAQALRATGFEEVGTYGFYYVEGDTVESLEAWSISADGQARAANPKKDVIDGSATTGTPYYHDGRLRTIRAPGLEVGSVAAYESIVVEELDNGSSLIVFGEADHRTLLSRLVLRLPAGWSSDLVSVRADGLEIRETAEGFVAEARDLDPLPHENFAPPDRSRLPRIWARWWKSDGSRGHGDWDSVGRWFYRLSEPVLEQAGEAAQIGERLRPVEPGDLTRALAESFRFAAQQVRYVAIDVGLGLGAGYKPAPPALVCSNRFGDCKDKSFLLRAIVSPWGLSHYPVLVRTRNLGPLIPEVPTPGQFNHCIVGIALPPGVGEELWSTVQIEGLGRILLLDPTVDAGSPWDLPTAVQGTSALLVHAEGASLIDLPVQPPRAGRVERELEARLDETGGVIEASLREVWNGNAATRVRYLYRGMSDSAHRDRVVRDLQDRFPGTSVSSYEIEGLDRVDVPLEEKTVLTGGRLAKRVGDLLILELGRLGFDLIGGALAAPPRTESLRIGMPREERVRSIVEVPPGWQPESVPDRQSLRTADLEFDSGWTMDENRLVYERTVRLLTHDVPPDRYATFRDSVGQLRRADAEAVVLVRPR